jgi:pimeloyl-ACP methyl ester carboxylesterase
VLRFLKQKLDGCAIEAAARALPPGQHDPARVRAAAALLASDQWLQFPESAAALTESAGAFQFPSTVPLGLPRNDIVHGKLFRAGPAWKSQPLVLLVHGWNAELHYLYVLPHVARALNRRGLNAALIELPLHLQRRPPRSFAGARDFISDDLATMLRATNQALADFHALARWALAQGCPNVALWGFSLGGWLAGLYVSGNNLASHAILTTPIIDLARAVRELSFCHPIRASLANSELDLSSLNLSRRAPRIPPQNIRVCQSQYDLFVPNETYAQLTSAWNLPPPSVCPQSHLSVLLSRRSMRGTIDWLAQQFAPLIRPSLPAPSAARA